MAEQQSETIETLKEKFWQLRQYESDILDRAFENGYRDAVDDGQRVAVEHVTELQEKLKAHFSEHSDPCCDHGAEWPCDVACAFGFGEADEER